MSDPMPLSASRTSTACRASTEAEILQGLDHPNVVRLVDVDLKPNKPFIVTELHPYSLAERAGRLSDMSVADRLDLFEQVCRGVAAAHTKGVIHRDIKPENILLTEKGQAVVADFGVAYIAQGERHTVLEEAWGPELHGPRVRGWSGRGGDASR